MKQFNVTADLGSVAIFDGNFRALFSNGFGDGEFIVSIIDEPSELEKVALNATVAIAAVWYQLPHSIKNRFLSMVGFLDVKERSEAWMSLYDVEDNKGYRFPSGRYGVRRDTDGNMLFHYIQECPDTSPSIETP